MVELSPVYTDEEVNFLYSTIEKHVKCTESIYANAILKDWVEMLPQFVKVMPLDYKKALERLKDYESMETELVTVTEEVF